MPKRTDSMVKRRPFLRRSCAQLVAASGLVLLAFLPRFAQSQITPDVASQLRSLSGNRVEAFTILGGDYGLAGGSFRSTGRIEGAGVISDATLTISKFGGYGEVGDPQPLGDLGVGWQPRVQGNMGGVEASNRLHTTALEGDINTYKTYGVEFGGGTRLWLNDAFSLAPTLMGLYGHTSDSYTANSAFMRANLGLATQLGLVNYTVETWTVRPALNAQYLVKWDRTILTLSSDSTYFYTESFSSSNSNVSISGHSGTQAAKADIDIPLGVRLFDRELRTGGFISYTALFGGLETGLGTSHFNEVHGRVVLDFLNQLWKFQWIGLGASYVWGPNFTGWTAGADVTFVF